MSIYNFGSINVDLIYRVPHLVNPGETLSSQSMTTLLGGKGANQSVAAARAGATVKHVGRINSADNWAVEQMQAAGVDVEHVELIEDPSGHAIIQVDDEGENAIILHGGANQSFSRDILNAHLASADSGDYLLLQNECNGLADAFDIALEKGMAIAFNPAPMNAEVLSLPLEKCHILIVNETEAEQLSGVSDPEAVLSELSKRYPDTRIVMTLGSKGALLHYQGKTHTQKANTVNAVDTTGAGDTFVGYFLASAIEGLDEPDCLQRACAAAELSVMKAGAAPSIPTRDELLAYTQKA